MSLDQNLFTLQLAPSTEENGALDLTDPSSATIHYRKRRHPDEQKGEIGYAWGLYDPLSESLLATVTAGGATSKQKTIELHNPSVKVNLSFTGTLTFKWSFEWENHTFEWRREECFLHRKPDPPVLVAVTREPAGKIKTSTVQVLDYNINRFDIQDKKGLEIVMLAALLTFQDQSEELHNASNANTPSGSRSRSNEPPTGPPPPPGKSGAEQIEALQVKSRAQQNEVYVGDVATAEEYAYHIVKMLKINTILYVIIRALGPEQVGKVVQIAEVAKRTFYKSGHHDEQLYQYATYDEMKSKKPKVINLDDSSGKQEYKPPQTLTIHLSKIPMPELQPKAPKPAKGPTPAPVNLQAPSNHGRDRSSSSKPIKNSTPIPAPQPPQPQPVASSSKPPKDKKDKDKIKKQKPGDPGPSRPPPMQMPIPPALNAAAKNKVPQSSPPLKMPGAMPAPSPSSYRPSPAPPSGQPGWFPQFGSSSGAQSPYNPAIGSAQRPPWVAPPGPPPPPQAAPGQQPGQSTSLTGMLTNGIANVGYSLLDRMTHKQQPTRPN